LGLNLVNSSAKSDQSDQNQDSNNQTKLIGGNGVISFDIIARHKLIVVINIIVKDNFVNIKLFWLKLGKRFMI